ncbi:MAG: leucine-rich repeat protein [Saccharofermentans sp.]|nr:leucine-rich repeat protein [Saccharofermentans sp.]
MNFKRLLAFVVSASMIIGMFPAFVLADENGSEPAETTVAETTVAKETEPAETKEKKPEEKKPQEPSQTKEEAPEQTEETKPSESEDKKPEETKPAETTTGEMKPEETKPEETEPEESKPQESSAPETTEPSETEPAESSETEPSATESSAPESADDKPTGRTAVPANGDPISTQKDGEPDNDELFKAFAESKLYKKNTRRALYASSGSRLKGYNKIIYDSLKPRLKQVAEGKATSTVFEVSLSELGLETTECTASQLGVSAVVINNKVTDAAYLAMFNRLKISIEDLHNALLADLAFELYWYDKTVEAAISLSRPSVGAREYSISGWKAYYAGPITVRFTVAEAYKAGPYVTDTTKITRVNTAVSTANSIVNTVKNKTDYDKLVYYRTKICDFVSYDHAAVGGAVPYGDPWQLISVFDGDSSTNVVCEGYSKAFKYLCDLTSFNTDISCILASGDVPGGGHMWNIVKMGDGKNYMVDVTNCDQGTVGYPDQLFLVGCSSGSVTAGYVFKTSYSSTRYIYDPETLNSFDYKDLTISTRSYLSGLTVGGDLGNGVSWQLKSGVMTISGSGAMPDFSDYTKAPWYDYRNYIQKIVIADGVTAVGNNAFTACQSVTSISLPNSLTRIGNYAFASNGIKSISIPGSVTAIGEYAFSSCVLLTSVTLLNGVEIIGDGAFSYTALTSIILPSSVTYIGSGAFLSVKDLASVTFLGEISTIGERAFKGTGITSVVIPESVKNLGAGSFENCTKLTSLLIDKDLYNKSGTGAFVGCPLTTITYYDSGFAVVNEIAKSGDYVFRITGAAVNGIGTACFMGVANPVEAVVIPGTVDIKGATYKVTTIAMNAFFGNTTIKTAYIGANVVVVGNNAFYGCSNLVKVSGGARIKTIGTNAFARCSKLSTFVITSKVLYKIGQKAFYYDSKLKTIYIKNTTKLTKGGVKNSLKGSSAKTVKVKKSKVRKYKKYFKKSNSGRSVKVKK